MTMGTDPGLRRCSVWGLSPVFAITHAHRKGAASAQRQKALATGPVSESRTRIGAKAIAQPPARRQRKAARLMEGDIIAPHMNLEFLSALILLLLVVDPFGNVPLVNAMLAGVAGSRPPLLVLPAGPTPFRPPAIFHLSRTPS